MGVMDIPFFRPAISSDEIDEVQHRPVLRSGWLTSGPKTSEFEKKFCCLSRWWRRGCRGQFRDRWAPPSGGRGLRRWAGRQRNRADADFHRHGRGYPLSGGAEVLAGCCFLKALR